MDMDQNARFQARNYAVEYHIHIRSGHHQVAAVKEGNVTGLKFIEQREMALIQHGLMLCMHLVDQRRLEVRHLGGVDTVEEAVHTGEDGEIVEQIKELLDTRVRPAVAQDGGDIVFHGFDRGVVYLHMQGACAGCPSSTLTLKMGIENLLRHYIPEVVEVRPVAA